MASRSDADHLPVNANPDAAGHQTRSFPLATHLSARCICQSRAGMPAIIELGTGHERRIRADRRAGDHGLLGAGQDLPFYCRLGPHLPAGRSMVRVLPRPDPSQPPVPDRRHLRRARPQPARRSRLIPRPPTAPSSTCLTATAGQLAQLLPHHSDSRPVHVRGRPSQKTNLVPVKPVLRRRPIRFAAQLRHHRSRTTAVGSEESPMDVSVGEAFAASVINAVLRSPAWSEEPRWCGVTTNTAATTTMSRRLPAVRPDSIAPAARPRATPPGGLRSLRLPRSSGGRVTVRPAELRLPRGPRPHVGAQAGRDQVEPARHDLPRRQRLGPARLPRPPQARVR